MQNTTDSLPEELGLPAISYHRYITAVLRHLLQQ